MKILPALLLALSAGATAAPIPCPCANATRAATAAWCNVSLGIDERVEDLASQFSSCTASKIVFELNASAAASGNTSSNVTDSGGRLLQRRRLNVPNVESCSFKDRVGFILC